MYPKIRAGKRAKSQSLVRATNNTLPQIGYGVHVCGMKNACNAQRHVVLYRTYSMLLLRYKIRTDIETNVSTASNLCTTILSCYVGG